MHITRRIWIQLAIFLVISLVAFTIMGIVYMRLPSLLFGIGRYTVTMQLPAAGGLYERGNVTYRGTEVGQVKEVHLNDDGSVNAVLSLRSDIEIPSDLEAQVHSQTAVGEQYVALLPRNGDSPPLKDGSVIPLADTAVPPDINALLDATNRGLEAIPGDNLKTAIDEGYTAFSGLGPDISRFIKGGSQLAIDGKKNLPELINVVENVAPVLNTQTDTADSVVAWASNLANITKQLKDNDPAFQGVLKNTAPATDELRALFERLQPTLPILLTNLVSLADVAVTYQPNIEQILVLLPVGAQDIQGIGAANRNTKQKYKGAFLDFNLNLNLPSACTTGFLPATQMRGMSLEDYPPPPKGDVYCRVPQDSDLNVRGARNIPCETRPGKRAPSVKICESDENYEPLNDGYQWKGDPNATLSGQGVPQLPPGTPALPAPLPIAAAAYDPATGSYVGPDGHVYTQANLAQGAAKEKTWQSMLLTPPGS